eukprot:14809664-Alexandrium_andersonii.AAC.1
MSSRACTHTHIGVGQGHRRKGMPGVSYRLVQASWTSGGAQSSSEAQVHRHEAAYSAPGAPPWPGRYTAHGGAAYVASACEALAPAM